MTGRFEAVQEGWDTELSIDTGDVSARARLARPAVPVRPLAQPARPAQAAPSENLALPAPTGWADGLTDTDGPRLWERLLAVEDARNLRHGRTATVVLVEFVGMRAAVDRWGSALALQQFVTLARVVAGDSRKSDHIARITPARFGVLLTETDEISAINFIDRMRERCRTEFDPATMGMRLAVGWASPPKGGQLVDAIAVAEQRLTVELRQER